MSDYRIYEPSPADIRTATRRLQRFWTADEERRRRVGPTQKPWTVPVVNANSGGELDEERDWWQESG